MRRKNKGSDLTDGERHLLLTGECWPRVGREWPDGSSWLRPYILVSPAGHDELLALWLLHREHLLREWGSRRGKPWASTQFDNDPAMGGYHKPQRLRNSRDAGGGSRIEETLSGRQRDVDKPGQREVAGKDRGGPAQRCKASATLAADRREVGPQIKTKEIDHV